MGPGDSAWVGVPSISYCGDGGDGDGEGDGDEVKIEMVVMMMMMVDAHPRRIDRAHDG